MKLLITGGSGFIGSNLIRHCLADTDHHLTNLDALTYAAAGNNLADISDTRYAFVHGDVCDASRVGPLVADADAVIHLAAESHVDRSIADAAAFLRTNVLGTQTLLDALRATPRPLVHVSTDEVFGDLPIDGDTRFTAESPVRPRSPYAASKAAGEQLALAAHHTHGLDVRVVNCGNNLGPWQHPEKAVPRFITALLTGDTVPLYGDGRNVRDWIHVRDHCDALLAVLERGRPGGRYLVGADQPRSNRELAETLCDLVGVGRERIVAVPDRPGHDRRYAVDASATRAALGWSPSRSAWPEMLAETVAWYRAHQTWWRPLMVSP